MAMNTNNTKPITNSTLIINVLNSNVLSIIEMLRSCGNCQNQCLITQHKTLRDCLSCLALLLTASMPSSNEIIIVFIGCGQLHFSSLYPVLSFFCIFCIYSSLLLPVTYTSGYEAVPFPLCLPACPAPIINMLRLLPVFIQVVEYEYQVLLLALEYLVPSLLSF